MKCIFKKKPGLQTCMGQNYTRPLVSCSRSLIISLIITPTLIKLIKRKASPKPAASGDCTPTAEGTKVCTKRSSSGETLRDVVARNVCSRRRTQT